MDGEVGRFQRAANGNPGALADSIIKEQFDVGEIPGINDLVDVVLLDLPVFRVQVLFTWELNSWTSSCCCSPLTSS